MKSFTCLMLVLMARHSMQSDEQQVACPTLTLKNGRVKVRGGKMAYFECRKKFTRVGQHLAVCLSNGIWSQPVPACVGRGCPDLGTLPHLTVTEQHEGGVLQFECPPNMRREGPQALMCDGTNWDAAPPRCLYGNSLGCDFEDPDLCGWSQDVHDDFDWARISGTTPTSDTGPDADHTSGTGHYIFMESSAPQKSGQVARLISPPYRSEEDLCLRFYYHMKGPDGPGEVGDLDVFIRTETESDGTRDEKVFHREGNQGNEWNMGAVLLPKSATVYKIVFAATRRDSFVSDIALDDIRVFNCTDPEWQGSPTTVSDVTRQPETTRTTTLPPSTKRRRTTPSVTSTTTTTSTTSTTRTTTTTTFTTTTTEPASVRTPATESSMSTSDMQKTTSTNAVSDHIPVDDQSKDVDRLGTETTPASKDSFLPDASTSTPDAFTSTPDVVAVKDSSGEPDQKHDHREALSNDGSKDETAEKPSDGRSTQGTSSSNSYLQLIVGVTLGLAVGMVVVGVLLWLWFRSRRERIERQIMKNQIDIRCSTDDSPYH